MHAGLLTPINAATRLTNLDLLDVAVPEKVEDKLAVTVRVGGFIAGPRSRDIVILGTANLTGGRGVNGIALEKTTVLLSEVGCVSLTNAYKTDNNEPKLAYLGVVARSCLGAGTSRREWNEAHGLQISRGGDSWSWGYCRSDLRN